MKRVWMTSGIVVAFSVFFLHSPLGMAQAKPESITSKQVQKFQLFTVELNGTKFWLPSTLVVKKGSQVKIHLITKVPAPNHVHGFKIPDFGIEEVVDNQGKEIEFTADKAGIFPILCHLHATHIGGQLIVLE